MSAARVLEAVRESTPTATVSAAETARVLRGRRAVVFDLDGTLVDTLPDMMVAMNAALAELGAAGVPPIVVRTTLHGGLEASAAGAIAYLGLPASMTEPLAVAYAKHYARTPARRASAYEDVPALLDRLVRDGVRIAVCTDKRDRQAEQVLEATGLLSRVAAVIGADACSRRAPDPSPLRLALSRLGVDADDTAFVGDSLVDVQAARAAGVDCVLHVCGYGVVGANESGVNARFGRYRTLVAALAA
jgi:phosphoglycolate phosphatase